MKRLSEWEEGHRTIGIVGQMRLAQYGLILEKVSKALKGETQHGPNGVAADRWHPTFGETKAYWERCNWCNLNHGYSDARLREECKKGGMFFGEEKPGPKS